MGLRTERVKVGGHWISCTRAGSGEPVLLVHGITTAAFIWRRILPELEDRYEVIAPDLLGCGESDKPLDVSYSLKAHAERLRELVEALHLAPVHFVGHDLGGGTGQILAVRHAGLLRDLTLVNSVGYDYWPVQPIVALRSPIFRQLLMATLDWGTLRWVVQRGLFHQDAARADLMECFERPLRTVEGRKAFLHFARCLDNRDLTSLAEGLGRLSLPVLIVRGDADAYLPAVIAERLHREIPGSRLERIATAGHFLQEDEPEWLGQTLRTFWEVEHG